MKCILSVSPNFLIVIVGVVSEPDCFTLANIPFLVVKENRVGGYINYYSEITLYPTYPVDIREPDLVNFMCRMGIRRRTQECLFLGISTRVYVLPCSLNTGSLRT